MKPRQVIQHDLVQHKAGLFTPPYPSKTPNNLRLGLTYTTDTEMNPTRTGSKLLTILLENPFECWHAMMYHSRHARFRGAIALLPNLDAD